MSIDAQANLRTVRDAIRFAVTRFNESKVFFGHGQVDAFDEAVFIVMRSLNLPIERLDPFLDAYLTHAEINTILQLIERRVKKRIPAAYLLNEAWLQGYRFYVDDRVIIPRSFIGELLKDGLQPWVTDPAAVTDVLDLCTGSGCLAVMAADLFGRARVDAIDLSQPALEVAQRNIDEYDFTGRVTAIHSDLFASVGNKRYDIILCNPPYVTDASMQRLPREYLHEPREALAGGTDGLSIVRQVLRQGRSHLKRGGLMFVEVGDGRSAVEKQFPDLPLTWLTTSAGDDMVFLVRQEELP
jgi:ribosomal protein L3 glutamine methyltransferase